MPWQGSLTELFAEAKATIPETPGIELGNTEVGFDVFQNMPVLASILVVYTPKKVHCTAEIIKEFLGNSPQPNAPQNLKQCAKSMD